MVSLACKEKIDFELRHVTNHSLLKLSIQLIGYENKNQRNLPDVSSIKFDCGVIPLSFCEHESFSFLPLLNENKS